MFAITRSNWPAVADCGPDGNWVEDCKKGQKTVIADEGHEKPRTSELHECRQAVMTHGISTEG
jgi:hypothetical protein